MVSEDIPLSRNDPMVIDRFGIKDEQANYAFRFLTYENLENIWTDEKLSFLRFRIFASDSFSGFGRVFTQDYHLQRDAIKEGDFEFGDSLQII